MQSRSLHPTDAEHKGFGHSPTSILQRKWCLYRQTHCLQEQRIVYTSALLAGATKPLNVLSKIWKSFCNRDRLLSSSTWSGRLFFCSGGFCVCIHSKQGKLVPTCNFWIWFYKSGFKNTCWASPKPDIQHKIAPAARFRWYRISKFLGEKIVSEESALIHPILHQTGPITSGFESKKRN